MDGIRQKDCREKGPFSVNYESNKCYKCTFVRLCNRIEKLHHEITCNHEGIPTKGTERN